MITILYQIVGLLADIKLNYALIFLGIFHIENKNHYKFLFNS